MIRRSHFFRLSAVLTALLLPLAACQAEPAHPAASGSPSATSAPSADPEATTVSDSFIEIAVPDQPVFEPTVTIQEDGQTATVTHSSGLRYTATGYASVADNQLVFDKGLTLVFDPADTAEAFNRWALGYTATQPLYGTVTYTVDGQTAVDDFYLEAGAQTFSCLIRSYLSGLHGSGVQSMTFETCNDETASFALCTFNTQDYPVYGENSDTFYLENARYKLGIRLIWGGGVNYLEDKRCEIKRLDNLVNQYDTGRLIQQSYYGVQENSEYTPGHFNGSKWVYNPVQGGDVAQNHSRLIDVVVTDASVYIKSQPMDWSNDNRITPSYMENTYTLYEDRIRVDNRFLDFSGWEHPLHNQELPAFYTVSYLSTFSFYNGTQPWTGDTLSFRDDLNFWGDDDYAADCTFRLRASNTETWCAWTNTTDDFGIGLYVPNIDVLSAGRYQFTYATGARSSATNYVAPLNCIQLHSFEPLEYSYLMTTGTLSDIRAIFTEQRDFAANDALNSHRQSLRLDDSAMVPNEYSYADRSPREGKVPSIEWSVAAADAAALDFTVLEHAAYLRPTNNAVVSFHSAERGTLLTATGPDPHVTIGYGGTLSANRCKALEITYLLPETNSPGDRMLDLFFCVGTITAPTADASVRESLIADGQLHTLTIDLSGKAFWIGNIHKLRIDFLDVCEAGDGMYIQQIVWK